MQKRHVITVITLLTTSLVFFWAGHELHNRLSTPIQSMAGVWTGHSKLETNTGSINYEVNALIQNESITLSLVAHAQDNTKFAFRLDLKYEEHTGSEYLFTVRDRTTTWLEQIRSQEKLDIPVIGHFLAATLVKKGDDQFFFAFDLGAEYVFGTLFEKGI
ncbi:hypothetical protein DZ860_03895 [Vibrio sinensis]|uniref:DUF1794 domain-containing protein n=1 Tax=Vibrio sinensis TaxID=2302434 RepID=A0A3A6QZ56_9VIBR|nr:hypothetical protein [Vibrio sinensis]RJX74284.1 hypothetical protein DZ860_03895 [Vibrio sinensis]